MRDEPKRNGTGVRLFISQVFYAFTAGSHRHTACTSECLVSETKKIHVTWTHVPVVMCAFIIPEEESNGQMERYHYACAHSSYLQPCAGQLVCSWVLTSGNGK